MAKVCKNIKELEKELMDCINIALDTNVADMVRDVMTDHIARDVYDKYNPKAYQRRKNQSGNDIGSPFDDTNNTGLLDPNNIISTIDGNGNLAVQNVTLGSRYYYENGEKKISQNAGEPIAEVIETGEGYDIGHFSRPFMQNTHDEIKEHNYHVEALKDGLRKLGLEVK